jgi:hypothetical protein
VNAGSPRTARVTFRVVLVLFGLLALTPLSDASADPHDVEIHGVYVAFSDGQNAKTNDRFHDEESVTSTWTITSRCPTFMECTGRVHSDQGWDADLSYLDLRWRAVHVIDDWEKCPDGSTAPGQQYFSFTIDFLDPSRLTGWDKTVGPSGGCGKNQWLAIEMPFTLTPKK